MALLVTSSVQIARFANALYGVKLGSVTNAAVLEDISVLGSSNAFNSYYTSSFGSMTNAQVATTMLANLGLAGNEAAQAYVEGQLNAAGSAKGAAVLSMLNAFSNLTSDATFGAAATAWNVKVTAAISYTASNTADVTTDFSAPVTSQTFTLTTSVDETTGGAGDDVIKGVLGTSGTYGVGDNINAGAGSDTLNLVSNGSGIAGGLVSLDSVETINVRLLSSAGEAVTMDASDWNGVETITNASSLSSTVLTVTGLSVATDVKLFGQTTINAGFNNTTTASAAVNVILSDAGSTTNGSNFTSGSAATINVDAGGVGLISSVSVDLQGTTNLAFLEGGANVKTYTVSGSGAGILNTNDTITSFNAASATGNLNVTFSAVSDVVVVGGAGNDTFSFGANFTNGDTVDGGSGTDTIALTVGSFNRSLTTTNVENATVTFNQAAGGELNASGSTVAAYTLVAGTANAASLSQLAASTFTLNDDSINGLTLDYASGVTSTTLNIGSAAGAVNVGTLNVTDVSAVNINAVGLGGVFTDSTFDEDLETLTITVSGGEADLSIASGGAIALGGASAVTITSAGSAGIQFGSAVVGNSLVGLTVNAAGSDAADITFGSASFVGSGVSVITLNAYDAADILTGALSVGNNATATSKDVAITVNVVGTGSDITIAGINTSGMGTVTLDINQAATGDVSIGAISLDVEASGSPTNFTLTDTAVIAGASAGIASISIVSGAGAQIQIGAITVGANNGQFSAGAINATDIANVDVSDLTVTLGASADGFFGAITTTGGQVGDITVVLGANASADFGAIVGSGIGSISINSTGATGFADFGGFSAGTLNIGSIEVVGAADGASVVMGTVNASGIGDISVAGAGDFSMTLVGTTVGTITSTQTASGQFVIDLSGVTNAVEVVLGRAANTVTSGDGNDQIVLTAGTTANDTITYSAGHGTDYIANFGAGAAATAGGADVIAVSSGSWAFHGFFGGSGTAVESFALGSAISSTAGAVSGSLIVLATAMANVTEVQAFLEQLDSVSAAAGDDFVVVWTDGGGDTTVSVVTFSGGVLASGVTLETLTVLTGVTPGALIAANFDIV